MKQRRSVIILALWLAMSLVAWPALAAVGDSPVGKPEVRLPVAPPPALAAPAPASGSAAAVVTVAMAQNATSSPVRQVRVDLTKKPTPAAPVFTDIVGIPTLNEPAAPAFDERQLVSQIGQPPAPPSFPGMSSPGPEVRMGVNPPGVNPPGVNPPGGKPAVPGLSLPDPDQWNLTADRIIGEHGSEYLDAVGNATISRGFNMLRADVVRYYQASRWVVLKGHVLVNWEGDVLEAEEAEFDLTNMLGWLKRGKVFVGKAHIHFESEYVRKYAASSYRFQNAKVTACDDEKPAWSFTAGEGDINIDGRTSLWHTRFNIKDQPVMAVPFLSLPGNNKRQSGFLIPEFSRSNKRGMGMNVPYYWVIDDERDVTFYENYMSKRGLMQGIEYRHAENSRTKGDWRIDFLHDSIRANTQDKEDKYLQTDNFLRPNRNRWWLRSKYNGFVAEPEWNFKLDMDLVSDQNYLREFGGGSSGFDSTRTSMLKEFGRDIDLADSLTRTSTAFVSRSWDKYGVTGKLAWTENLAYMNGNNLSSKNPTTQNLPEINAFAFKDAVPGTPLEWEAAGRFNYFWREYGTRAIRTDLHPTVSLPLNLGPVTLMPSVGLRNTAYSVGGYANEPLTTTTNRTPARTVYELGFNGFTEVSRVFDLNAAPLEALPENVGKSSWGAIRHSITPRLELAYVPAPQSQNRLPVFDSLDRLERKNLVTYSLTNVLDRRRTSVAAAPVPGGGNATIPVAGVDYLDFFRVRMEQSFDRDEAARTESLATYSKRPFSDLMLEGIVQPEKHVKFSSRTYYSPYMHKATEHEHLLTLTRDNVGEFRFGHDYLAPVNEYKRQRTKEVQALLLGADAKITDKLSITGTYRLDIAGDTDLEKSVGVNWREQCYEFQLKYFRKPSDDGVELRFNLLDFGTP